MGIMDKFIRKTDDEYDVNDPYYNEFDFSADNGATQAIDTPTASTSTGVSAGISLAGAAIELKVVKPERFDSVPQIADHLLNKRTVVLNLENTNKETARRLIDFLSGVAYSIDGQLKKIANNAYVITPNNVDVSGEQLRETPAAAPQEAAPAAAAEADPFAEI